MSPSGRVTDEMISAGVHGGGVEAPGILRLTSTVVRETIGRHLTAWQ
jgi:hypothetical protein